MGSKGTPFQKAIWPSSNTHLSVVKRTKKAPRCRAPKRFEKNGISRVLDQLRKQLVVCLVLFASGDEGFHRFDRVQIDEGAAEFTNGFDMLAGEELFLFTGAALRDVDGWE